MPSCGREWPAPVCREGASGSKARTLTPSLGSHHEPLTRERCRQSGAPCHEVPTRSPRPTAHKAPHPGSSNAPALVQGLTDLGAGVSHVPLPATAEKRSRSWRALALKRLRAGRGRGPRRPIPCLPSDVRTRWLPLRALEGRPRTLPPPRVLASLAPALSPKRCPPPRPVLEAAAPGARPGSGPAAWLTDRPAPPHPALGWKRRQGGCRTC